MPNDRITYFEVEYTLEDVSALNDSVPTTSSNISWANINLLQSEGNSTNYMTCEQNQTLLDGSFEYYPESNNPANVAFWSSEMSDENGEFITNPIITVNFTERTHSSFALTLHFLGNPATRIKVTWQDSGGIVLAIKEFTNEDNTAILYQDVQNYKRILIEFLETIPYNHIKIYKIMYGMVINWNETNVRQAGIVQEMNRISDKLSINTLSFDVIDIGHDMDAGNPSGLHNYFQKKQKMYPYEWVNGEKLSLGKYFLDEFSSGDNLGKMSSVSYIGLLDSIDYTEGSVYKTGISARTLLQSILTTTAGLIEDTSDDGTGIGDYWIDPSIRNITCYGSLPIMKCREALREVLFICSAVIDSTQDQKMKIYSTTLMVNETISRNMKISTEITKKEYVHGIELKYTDYTLDTDYTEITNEIYEPGTYQINFSEPYSIDTLNITGATLTTIKTFYCIFTVNSSGTVVLRGKKYSSITNSVITKNNILEAGEQETIKSYSSYLANAITAKQIASSILKYLSYRLEIKIKHITNNSAMTNWKVIKNANILYNDYIAVYDKRDIDLSGGFVDTAILTGYENDSNQYSYAGIELYTGESIGTI